MIIPHEKLSAEILRGIIEEYITREGTEYGAVDFALDTKVTQVQKQLASGKAVVVFNPEDESCSIVTAAEARRIEEAQEENE